MDLIAALRRLDPDAILVDTRGKAWTAEDLEYTLLDQADKNWNGQTVELLEDGIYRALEGEASRERIYFFSEATAAKPQ